MAIGLARRGHGGEAHGPQGAWRMGHMVQFKWGYGTRRRSLRYEETLPVIKPLWKKLKAEDLLLRPRSPKLSTFAKTVHTHQNCVGCMVLD